MSRPVKHYFLSILFLCGAGLAALRLYPWPVTPGSGVVLAFLLEAALFLSLGFPDIHRRLGSPCVLMASAVAPYLIYSLPAGVFSWKSLALLTLLAALAALWFLVVPRKPVTDVLFLGLVAAVSLARIFPDLYAMPAPRLRVDFLGQMMWRRVAILAILLHRPMPGIQPGFVPKPSQWLAGAREYLFFLPIGAALSLGTGFVRFQPAQGEWWQVGLTAAGIFLGMLWFVALTEEFFFRGSLQQWLTQWTSSTAWALVIASAVFGLAHLPYRYPPLNWRFALVAAAAGIFYGRAFNRGGLGGAMVCHALVNVSWRILFV